MTFNYGNVYLDVINKPHYLVMFSCNYRTVVPVVVLPFIYIKMYKLVPSGPPVDLLYSPDSRYLLVSY